MNDVMHRKRAQRIWGDLKKVSSWVSGSEEDGWFSLARRSQASGLVSGVHIVWGRWKSQHRKNVYLSPYVEKPLNSKVIKSFVPEQKSRKCFSCFGIPMFYVFMLWTFYVRFTYSCIGMLHYVMRTPPPKKKPNKTFYLYVSLKLLKH